MPSNLAEMQFDTSELMADNPHLGPIYLDIWKITLGRFIHVA